MRSTVKHQRETPSVFWYLRHLRGISQNPETFKTDKERRSQTQGPETLDHHLETFQDRFKSLCNNLETKSQHCSNAQRRNRINCTCSTRQWAPESNIRDYRYTRQPLPRALILAKQSSTGHSTHN
jgi:hypothetical protein